ncbi:MAG: DUF4304 domain-containing protein, partial [Flavisolibacter sp.]
RRPNSKSTPAKSFGPLAVTFMKTRTEIKFYAIIKQSFHEFLKPRGFKKKGNNFYLQLPELGQIINIQKSSFYSKDHILFTVNTGIFIPEHWMGLIYNQGKDLPSFPTEPECLIRKRIGELRKQHDKWYDLDEKSDELKLISEMKDNLERYILPYCHTLSTREDVLKFLDANQLHMQPLGKLIVYGELHLIDKAKREYDKMFREKLNPHFLETVKEYCQKYGIS